MDIKQRISKLLKVDIQERYSTLRSKINDQFNRYLTILKKIGLVIWQGISRIFGIIRMLIKNALRIDGIKLIQIFIYTISIVTFLTAIEYFSAKPSLNIRVINTPMGFYMDTIIDFYKNNNIEIPKALIEDEGINKLFSRVEKNAEKFKDYIVINDFTSDMDVITAIKRGQDTSLISRKIDMLTRQFGKYDFKKLGYFSMDNRGFYPEEDFKKTLNYIKSKVATEDYYIFLSATLFSREVQNLIWIKNDGDVDLRNVEVIIPSPLSKITGSRTGNVLNTNVTSILLHEIKNNGNEVRIYLPSLKKDNLFGVDITTRENQIAKDDILYSFNEDKIINKRKMLRDGLIAFCIMSILGLFFKGNHENSNLHKS